MRISDSNTGKAAWNKGRKHSEETKARIRAATAEAMRRPEVHAKIVASLQFRSPMSEASRAKISAKAREKVAAVRSIMLPQAHQLREQMLISGDPVLREMALEDEVIQDIMSLGWFAFRRGWENLAEMAWAHGTFFDELEKRVRKRWSKAARVAAKEESKRVMAAAHSQLHQLRHAEAKLQLVERALASLKQSRPALQRQPDRLLLYKAAEVEAAGLVERCRKQVDDLSVALQALEEAPWLSSASPGAVARGLDVGDRSRSSL